MATNLGSLKAPVLKTNKHKLTQSYKAGKHNGIDLVSSKGADWIISIADGTVTYVGYSSSRGYYVEVTHNKTYKSRYLHMKKGTFKVSKGQKISKGTILGYMGNTGDSHGTHLHLAIVKNNSFVNPLPYVKGEKLITSSNINYKSYDNVKKKWLPAVSIDDTKEYAGIKGHSLTGLVLEDGTISFHYLGAGWSDNINYCIEGTKKVDAIMVKNNNGLKLKYRVHRKGIGWLSFVTGYDSNNYYNGYAGIFKYEIDAIQIIRNG